MLLRMIKSLTSERGLGGLLAILLELECHHLSKSIGNFKKMIFFTISIWLMGFVFITIGLIGLSAMLVHAWGVDHLIESLSFLTFLFIGIGYFLIYKASRKIA